MTTKLSSITWRSFCRGLAAMAVLPLAARCGAVAQTDPQRKIQTSILEVPGARLSMRPTVSAQSWSWFRAPLAQPTASEG
jgi:hypothetical protein